MPDHLFKRGEIWFCWVYQDGRRVKRSTRCTDRRAAILKLKEFEREAQGGAGGHPSASSRGLRDALADLVQDTTAGRSEATLDMYQKHALHLLRLLGEDTPIGRLTLADVDGYATARLAEALEVDKDGAPVRTVARETVRKELGTLRQALERAKAHGHLRTDPRTLFPRFRVQYQPRDRHLSEDELARLLAALDAGESLGRADPEQVASRRLWVMLAAYAGCRASEVEGLTWDRVDLAGGWLMVAGTKTRGSRRRVPLASHLAAALREAHEAQGEPAAGPVVQPWGNSRRDLAAACRRAGIGQASANDLRRTFASWLKQKGVDSMTVARLMGHTTSRMVELVYGHLTADTLKGAVALLSGSGGRGTPVGQRKAAPAGKRGAPGKRRAAGCRR
jgi:integrase